MQIQQLDAIGAQPAETFLALAAEHVGPAVGDHLGPFVVDATLGGDDHFIAPVAQGAADQVFAFAVGAVDVGSIEMIDAQVEALADRGNALRIARVERRDSGDRPATQRNRSDGKAGVSEGSSN